MGIYDYNILSEEEQWDVLWDEGEFITSLNTKETDYILYAIDKFFVEVVMHPESSKVIRKSDFLQGQCMEKYIGNLPFNV